MTVHVNDQAGGENLSRKLKGSLRRVSQQLLDSHDLGHGEVSITLVDSGRLRELNCEYRSVDEPTDVLAFGFLEPEEREGVCRESREQILVGDIYISVEKAREQAQAAGHGVEREILTLAVHGMLHLLGFDHADDESRAVMREMEGSILSRLKQ